MYRDTWLVKLATMDAYHDYDLRLTVSRVSSRLFPRKTSILSSINLIYNQLRTILRPIIEIQEARAVFTA